MRNKPVIQISPPIVLTLTATVLDPARAEAVMLIKPALGSANATQPTTRMKGGNSIGNSARPATSRLPGMSVLVHKNERLTPRIMAKSDEPAV